MTRSDSSSSRNSNNVNGLLKAQTIYISLILELWSMHTEISRLHERVLISQL
jgi:hypothetical protein